MMCRSGNWKALTTAKRIYLPHFDTNIIINENGLKFHVDIENGQKTGYFLDQQDNRRAIRNIVKDADVLGAFIIREVLKYMPLIMGRNRY